MVAITTDPDQLHDLVGRHVRYRDRRFVIIDVLTEGPALVLHDPLSPGRIQANQFGDATRLGPATITLPLLDPATGEVHALMRDLELMPPAGD